MGYIFSFLWLCTMLICVIIHAHRVMMSVSFHQFSYPPHFPLGNLKFFHSSLKTFTPPPSLYIIIHLLGNTFGL